MIGQVVIPKKNVYGCKEFVSSVDFPDLNTSTNFFVLVKRGICSNPTKVRNVEKVGGMVALIGDNRQESLTQLVMEDAQGSSLPVRIPGYMIEHDAASQITEELNYSNVYLKAELSIETQGKELTLGLFISSSVDLTSAMMTAFEKLAAAPILATRDKSSIDIHAHTFSCPLCPSFIKSEDCISNGNYCAYFPKRNDYWIEQMDQEDVSAQ